jgi:transcription initiation factor TFIIF subunit beta
MADITMKNEVKPEIKVDEESPSKLHDVEAFEDDNDLYVPPTGDGQPSAWLVKVSDDMWKAWNDLYSAQPEGEPPMEIGKLRVYHTKPGGDPNKHDIQIRLKGSLPQHLSLPKNYNLDVKSTSYNNTVVFSEKDLPGHRSQPFGNRTHNPGAKPTGLQTKAERYGPKKPGSYRTAIPKQTALAPMIVNEAVANPVEDDAALDFFKQSYNAALNAGNKAQFSESVRGVSWHPSAAVPTFAFGSMTSKPGKGNKKVVKDKAVRLEKAQLLDAIQQCFREYQYWSLKALRNRLHQPEAYIRETLDEIATLVKSGDFVQNYKLKPDYVRLNELQASMVKEEMAPVKSETDEGTGDEMGDDDDEMGFEDVEMKSGS